MLPCSGVRGETVWKIGISPEIGLRRRSKGPKKPQSAASCCRRSALESPWTIFQTVSELDSSHLLARRVGYAPCPSSRSGLRCTYPSQRSERGFCDASLGRTLGHTPSGSRLRFVCSLQPLSGGGRLFTGCPRAPTRKSLSSTVEPSTYAVCQAAKGQNRAGRLSEKDVNCSLRSVA